MKSMHSVLRAQRRAVKGRQHWEQRPGGSIGVSTQKGDSHGLV